MKYKIVSIKDRVADVFGTPFYVPNVAAAIRSFGDEVRRPHSDERPNNFNLHADDFDLYLMGEFDDAIGEFDIMLRPESIALGRDFKA